MIKMINLEKIRVFTKQIYQGCSEIRINQEELEDMLTVIDKLEAEYSKGRISKETFSADEKKLKKESLKMINKINGLISSSLKTVEALNKEIASQKVKNDSYGNRKGKRK